MIEREGIDVVEKVHLARAPERDQIGQRLTAKAGSADAEYGNGAGVFAEPAGDLSGFFQIVAARGNAQKFNGVLLVRFAQPAERALGFAQGRFIGGAPWREI